MHHRSKILQALKDLIEYESIVDVVVYNSRATPSQMDQLPAIFIYGLSEINDVEYLKSTNFKEFKRTLDVVFDIKMYQYDFLDSVPINNYLDDIALQVEFILNKYRTVKEIYSDINLISTRISIDQNSEKIIGSCELTCECVYYADAYNDSIKSLAEYLETFETTTTRQKAVSKQLFKMRGNKNGSVV